MNTTSNPTKIIGAALLIGLLIIGGLSAWRSVPPAPVRLLLGLDTSEGAANQLGGWAYLTSRVASKLDTRSDRLTLCTVCDRTEEFYDDAPRGGTDGMRDIVLEAVRKAPAHAGTYSALFWSHVASRVEASKTPAVVLLCSDGDEDMMCTASKAAIARAAQRMAACPQTRAVAIYGVNAENRETLRSEFACLGDRFHLSGRVEAEDIPRISALVEQARQKKHQP